MKRPGDGVGADEFLPNGSRSVPLLRKAARHCKGCDLYERATQTVFGQGETTKPIMMLVGEQPGDAEDLAGEPFVGPAGRVLDQALDAIGLARSAVYITNAVKHFKWEPRGPLRLHKNPSAREVAACRPWLLAEMEAVDPVLVVCLGATAARSLLGPSFRVTKDRGKRFSGPLGTAVFATVHPASIVRIRDSGERRLAREQFVRDLRGALSHVRG